MLSEQSWAPGGKVKLVKRGAFSPILGLKKLYKKNNFEYVNLHYWLNKQMK